MEDISLCRGLILHPE